MQFQVAQHSVLYHLDVVSWHGRVIQNPQLTTVVETAKRLKLLT